jgi:RimJ/RimL family protein N-acetyltransferase
MRRHSRSRARATSSGSSNSSKRATPTSATPGSISSSPHHQGRGLGTDAIRTLARYLIEERGHHRLTIDPAADNAVAIRAYEKVGFRPVGVLRAYWRSPDGTWRDGLLMDLLASELDP